MRVHSDDAFAPVAYLKLKQLHLEEKHNVSSVLHTVKVKGHYIITCRKHLELLYPLTLARLVLDLITCDM